MTNRKFWVTVGPFLTNKGMITSNEISHKQGDHIINNEGKVAEFFNNNYKNIVENTAGKKPLSVPHKDNVTLQQQLILCQKNVNITKVYRILENTLNKRNVLLF